MACRDTAAKGQRPARLGAARSVSVAADPRREADASALVRQHVAWVLEMQNRKSAKDAKGREEAPE